MFSQKIMEKFANLRYAGALRGSNGTGKSGNEECGELVKIYLYVNNDGVIKEAKFKAYGGVCTIVACECACDLIEGRSLEAAMRTTYYQILEEMGDVDESRLYSITLAEEAVKNAIEDYYKRKEKELKKLQEKRAN